MAILTIARTSDLESPNNIWTTRRFIPGTWTRRLFGETLPTILHERHLKPDVLVATTLLDRQARRLSCAAFGTVYHNLQSSRVPFAVF